MSTEEMESLEDFRARARAFIQANIPMAGPRPIRGTETDEEELADAARCRELQRMLFDGGLAGIVVPKKYGGQGLTPAHAHILDEEMVGREFPSHYREIIEEYFRRLAAEQERSGR